MEGGGSGSHPPRPECLASTFLRTLDNEQASATAGVAPQAGVLMLKWSSCSFRGAPAKHTVRLEQQALCRPAISVRKLLRSLRRRSKLRFGSGGNLRARKRCPAQKGRHLTYRMKRKILPLAPLQVFQCRARRRTRCSTPWPRPKLISDANRSVVSDRRQHRLLATGCRWTRSSLARLPGPLRAARARSSLGQFE